MSTQLSAVQHFSRGRGANPFELPHVHATSHIEALNTLPNNGQLVVLAPLASLSVGLARELFINCGWASDPANTLLLPLGADAPGSMASQLADFAETGGAAARGPQQLRVEVAWRVPLSDDELQQRKAAEEAALRIKVRPDTHSRSHCRPLIPVTYTTCVIHKFLMGHGYRALCLAVLVVQ